MQPRGDASLSDKGERALKDPSPSPDRVLEPTTVALRGTLSQALDKLTYEVHEYAICSMMKGVQLLLDPLSVISGASGVQVTAY